MVDNKQENVQKEAELPVLENSKEKEVVSEPKEEKKPTVGALLRSARMEKRLDLRDISSHLCIRYQFLKALEDGAYDDLPGEAYANGFVRSYASYLGLDSVEVMSLYKKEFFAQNHLTERDMSLCDEDVENITPTPKVLLLCILFIFITFVIWQNLSGSESENVEITQIELEESSAEEVLIQPEVMLEKRAEGQEVYPPVPTTKPVYNETEKVASENVSEDEEETVETMVNELISSTSDASSDEVIEEDGQKVIVVKPVEIKNRTYGLHNKNSRVTLVATQEVWAEVKRNDEVIFTRLMNKGDKYQVPVWKPEELKLETGNAGGLDLYVDNQRVSSLGRTREVRYNISLIPEDYFIENVEE